MDIASPQTRRPAHASPRPVRASPAGEVDAPLAVFVGTRFAEALHEGLSRASRPRGAGPARPADSAPLARPPGCGGARQDALLAEHAEEILARFAAGLRALPGVTAAERTRITAWARRVLGPAGSAGPVRPGAGARWEAVAGSLLVESAADVLPDGSAGVPRALGALARAIRLTGTGGTRSGDLGLPERRQQGLQ
ncbi:hypothetical protein [Streptomyces sp. NBC_01614]|uniref:Uncharacterized protein n=1 Tax=Streptomyces sp. NBC_00180 TaxID=2903632 RepID=A0AAU1I9E8_9ACTN